jgi:hypothetical protein
MAMSDFQNQSGDSPIKSSEYGTVHTKNGRVADEVIGEISLLGAMALATRENVHHISQVTNGNPKCSLLKNFIFKAKTLAVPRDDNTQTHQLIRINMAGKNADFTPIKNPNFYLYLNPFLIPGNFPEHKKIRANVAR